MSGPQDHKEIFRPEKKREIARIIITVGFIEVECIPDEFEDRFVCPEGTNSRCVGVFEKKIRGWTFSCGKQWPVRDVFVWRGGDTGGACYALNQYYQVTNTVMTNAQVFMVLKTVKQDCETVQHERSHSEFWELGKKYNPLCLRSAQQWACKGKPGGVDPALVGNEDTEVVIGRAILQVLAPTVVPKKRDCKHLYVPVDLKTIKSFVHMLQTGFIKNPGEVPGILHLAAAVDLNESVIMDILNKIPAMVRCNWSAQWLEDVGDLLQKLTLNDTWQQGFRILESYRICSRGWYWNKVRAPRKKLIDLRVTSSLCAPRHGRSARAPRPRLRREQRMVEKLTKMGNTKGGPVMKDRTGYGQTMSRRRKYGVKAQANPVKVRGMSKEVVDKKKCKLKKVGSNKHHGMRGNGLVMGRPDDVDGGGGRSSLEVKTKYGGPTVVKPQRAEDQVQSFNGDSSLNRVGTVEPTDVRPRGSWNAQLNMEEIKKGDETEESKDPYDWDKMEEKKSELVTPSSPSHGRRDELDARVDHPPTPYDYSPPEPRSDRGGGALPVNPGRRGRGNHAQSFGEHRVRREEWVEQSSRPEARSERGDGGGPVNPGRRGRGNHAPQHFGEHRVRREEWVEQSFNGRRGGERNYGGGGGYHARRSVATQYHGWDERRHGAGGYNWAPRPAHAAMAYPPPPPVYGGGAYYYPQRARPDSLQYPSHHTGFVEDMVVTRSTIRRYNGGGRGGGQFEETVTRTYRSSFSEIGGSGWNPDM